MRCIEIKIAVAALCLILWASTSAQAQTLPAGINLGATSFLDGAPPGPGVYFFQYYQNYHATQIKDARGQTIPLPDPKLDVSVSISQLVVLFDHELPLLRAKPAIDILMPVVWTNLDFGAPGKFPQSNGMGLGDITIGPAIQFDTIKDACGRPIFAHRLEAQFIIPTGKYSPVREIGPGSGFFSFDPYWAGTLFLTPKWEVSYRAHYLWNGRQDEPPLRRNAQSLVAGEAFHINFCTSYEVIEKKLRLGFNGYFLDQTTLSKADGITIPGREKVLAVGPGMQWRIGKQSLLNFNYYFETDVVSRPEGNRLNLQFMHKF